MRTLFLSVLVILVCGGCASKPQIRAGTSGLPPLDSGWSRVYVSAGVMNGIKLWSVNQVGPVFIKDRNVGSTARDEHFVIDLPPGIYEAYCHPEKPDKNFPEKRQYTFKANATRFLACDMGTKGAGMYFGLIGALASKYLTRTYLTDRPLGPNSRLVSYNKVTW